MGELVGTCPGSPVAPQVIERPPPRGGQEPRARAIRHPARGPVRERLLEGLLGDLLRSVDVADDAEHGRHHSAVLQPEHLRYLRPHAVRVLLLVLARSHGSGYYALRSACSIAPVGVGGRRDVWGPATRHSDQGASDGRLHRPDRPHVDVPAVAQRDLLGPLDRLVLALAVDEVEAPEGLLGLGERPVHDLALAGLEANPAAVAVGPQALAVHHLAGGAQLLGEAAM